MPNIYEKLIPKLILLFIALGLILCFAYLLFTSPTLYDPDSYYNIAVSNFIKDLGLHYKFHWAQFSTFKDYFSDKDLSLHILSIPSLFITSNKVLAGKYSIVLLMILLVSAYIFILRKYVSDALAAVLLLLPFSSWISAAYFLQLRSATLAIMLTTLGIYSLINKKNLWILIIAVLYPLTHVSFFMFAIFAIVCELLRYGYSREVSISNISIVIGGSILGCLIHPNFPNNLSSIYLNAILVPFYRLTGANLGFSGELNPLGATYALVGNFAMIFAGTAIIWILLRSKKRMSLSSSVWLAVSLIYTIFALFSMRYWYHANMLFFIFAASFTCDIIKNRRWIDMIPKIKVAVALLIIAAIPLVLLNVMQLKYYLSYFATRSAHYEKVALWMDKNIPEGETIYHSYWDDSSYFICLNPKNNYINTNDPIYMFYRFPRELSLIDNLSMGMVGDPQKAINKIFKARYGYLRKYEPLYNQVKRDTDNFDIIYEDSDGAVFEVLQK